MSHRLTIDLPDEVYRPIAEGAERSGRAIEDVIIDRLRPPRRNHEPTTRPEGTGLSVLLQYAGCISSDHPRGADNEAIDEDLAREYGSTHDDEA